MSTIRKLIAIQLILFFSLVSPVNAGTAVKSMVIFGDSLSDIGNTTHLLKSLRKEESPGYLVYPFKVFVLDKMEEYADDYYVPQIVLDAGKQIVSQFFDDELAYVIANVVGKIKRVPVLPVEPYYAYRFSNGSVWNEYLAMMLGLNLIDKNQYENQAFGGSWAVTYDYQLTVWNMIRHPIGTIKDLINGKLIPPSLGLVTQTYLMVNKQLSSDSLYVLFAGGNDYLNVLQFEDNYNPAVMTTYVDNVISSIESSSKRLINAGAKHLIIFGVPDVGVAPKFVNTSDEAVLSQATRWHNERLEKAVDKWRGQYEEVTFTYVDIQKMLEEAILNPEEHDLTNVTDACIDVKLPKLFASGFVAQNHPFKNNSVLQYAETLQYTDRNFATGEKNYHVCANPDEYLFWDEVHPTKKVHQSLALKVCQNLQANGYEVQCQA